MKKVSLGISMLIVVAVLILGIYIDLSDAAPCTPCSGSWGSILQCANPNPAERPACCSCTKDIIIEFALEYYLYLDELSISPEEMLVILESDSIDKQTIIDRLIAGSVNDTWGIIRALFRK